MKEIKFRAWDKTLRLMGNVDVLEWNVGRKNDGSDKELIYIRANKPTQYEMQTGSGKHLKEYVLMQYTGLKDKNGKEIYEGDIVINGDFVPDAYAWNEWKRQVVYDNEQTMFTGLDGERIKIIGNIYENPELNK